jgi:hypothetical protein
MKDGHTLLLLKGKSRNEEQRLPSFSKIAPDLIPESDLEGFTPLPQGRPTDAEPSAAALAQRQSRQRRRKTQTGEPPRSSELADEQAG